MFFYRLLCDFSVLKFSMAYLLVITIPKITEMGQLLLKYSVVQMVAGTLFLWKLTSYTCKCWRLFVDFNTENYWHWPIFVEVIWKLFYYSVGLFEPQSSFLGNISKWDCVYLAAFVSVTASRLRVWYQSTLTVLTDTALCILVFLSFMFVNSGILLVNSWKACCPSGTVYQQYNLLLYFILFAS